MSEPKSFLKDSYVERNADQTREHYDAWAQSYDEELTANRYATPRRSLKGITALVEDRSAHILDVGCGTGLFGRELVDAGYTTIDGCDYSEGMLAKAQATNLYRSLFTANLNEAPLRNGEAVVASGLYDAAAVVGVFSFGHVEALAMDEIARVVKPGGAIVIGLNDKFWSEGSLAAKLGSQEEHGVLQVVEREAGDHLPGTGLTGWVISCRKL